MSKGILIHPPVDEPTPEHVFNGLAQPRCRTLNGLPAFPLAYRSLFHDRSMLFHQTETKRLEAGEITVQEYLNLYRKIQRYYAHFICFHSASEDEFAAFCHEHFPASEAQSVIDHEKQHAKIAQEFGLHPRFEVTQFYDTRHTGIQYTTEEYLQPNVEDGLQVLGWSWSRERLLAYLNATSIAPDNPSRLDQSMQTISPNMQLQSQVWPSGSWQEDQAGNVFFSPGTA